LSTLPHFLIAGASKTGTEWLMHCLADHPGIFMPRCEIRYFNYRYDRGQQWYESRFSGAGQQQTIGEKSPGYLRDPQAPARIRECMPDVKLVFLLRDPIERAYSHYRMELRAGRVSEDVERVLAPGHTFIEEGRYNAHLARYLRYFDPEQTLVLLYDDLKQDPRTLLKTVCRFVGVSEEFESPLMDQAFHATGQRPRFPRLYRTAVRMTRRIAESGPAGAELVSRIRRSGWQRLFHRINQGAPFPSMSPAHQRMLADYYREDLTDLSAWLDRDLTRWLDRYGNDQNTQKVERLCA